MRKNASCFAPQGTNLNFRKNCILSACNPIQWRPGSENDKIISNKRRTKKLRNVFFLFFFLFFLFFFQCYFCHFCFFSSNAQTFSPIFLHFFCFFKFFQLLNQFSTPPGKNIGFNTTLFPGGPPPQYWAGSNRVNFGVRMRTGALRLIWSNPSDFIQNCTKCSSDQRIQTEVAGQKTILKHRKKEKNMVFFNKSFFLASQRTYVDNLKIYHLSTCKPVQWWPGPESDKITAQKIKKMVAILCIFFFFLYLTPFFFLSLIDFVFFAYS